MNVYDFAPDLDLSKEGEGSIFGVKGIEYAKVVSCVGCHRGGVGGALG